MKRITWIMLMLVMVSCSTLKTRQPTNSKTTNFSFKSCGENLNFSAITLESPLDFKQEKVIDEMGFCEYRLYYPDLGVLYLSSNTVTGSKLNYKNRFKAGITSYSVNRSLNDTIRNKGLASDGSHWKEWINSIYTIGYTDVNDTTAFNKIIESVQLINDANVLQERGEGR